MDATNHIDPLTPPPSWPTPPPPPTPASNTIFFGRFGLRAGWGIAIFIAAFAIFTVIGGLLAVASSGTLHKMMQAQAYASAHPGQPKPKTPLDFVPIVPIVSDGITFLGLLGLCWFFSKGERRPLASYGIGKNRLADILPGAFWGLATMGVLIFVLHALHLLVFDGQNLHGIAILLYGLKWLLAFLFVGFSEEYTFRGYAQFTLMRGVWGLAEKISAANPRPFAFWIAATILSLVFALAHTGNGGETFFGLVQVFLAGIAFAYALWRTGSLWWGIGFHMTWDWAQSYLFGVADSGNISIGRLFITHPQGKPILSGGPDGPEGSIFASIALLLTILIIHLTARPGPQPAIEQQPEQPPAAELPTISPYAA
jgi:membrane protease YdiL (CAAX protease family)